MPLHRCVIVVGVEGQAMRVVHINLLVKRVKSAQNDLFPRIKPKQVFDAKVNFNPGIKRPGELQIVDGKPRRLRRTWVHGQHGQVHRAVQVASVIYVEFPFGHLIADRPGARKGRCKQLLHPLPVLHPVHIHGRSARDDFQAIEKIEVQVERKPGRNAVAVQVGKDDFVGVGVEIRQYLIAEIGKKQRSIQTNKPGPLGEKLPYKVQVGVPGTLRQQIFGNDHLSRPS